MNNMSTFLAIAALFSVLAAYQLGHKVGYEEGKWSIITSGNYLYIPKNATVSSFDAEANPNE